jgi:hypothetical protein
MSLSQELMEYWLLDKIFTLISRSKPHPLSEITLAYINFLAVVHITLQPSARPHHNSWPLPSILGTNTGKKLYCPEFTHSSWNFTAMNYYHASHYIESLFSSFLKDITSAKFLLYLFVFTNCSALISSYKHLVCSCRLLPNSCNMHCIVMFHYYFQVIIMMW